jgi:hypothetical protein
MKQITPQAAIIGGSALLAYVATIWIRGDTTKQKSTPGSDAIATVREAERQVEGKHADVKGKDMNARKWV